MAECVFCKIIAGKAPGDIFYDDEKCLVMLDSDWAVKGHSLVVWKEHKINASDLSEPEFSEFGKVYRKAESVLLHVLGKDRAIILKAGLMVSHFHFHIYPVDHDLTLKEMQAMIAKKMRVEYSEEEKKELLESLKRHYGSVN